MFKDSREEWYDAKAKVSVTVVDVSTPAADLSSRHLCGPVAAHYLAKALAAVSLLASETSEKDECVAVQMKCSGPLGGFNVECTADGTLRGYTEKKVLDEFDGLGEPDDRKVLGNKQLQVTRSVPGRIISQGISNSVDGYLAGSLQRKACIYLSAKVNNDLEILQARGVLVEALPDSKMSVTAYIPEDLSLDPRQMILDMGLENAELKKISPLRFACRCTPERAASMIGALDEKERASLPPKIDITCHMCGRTFTVAV
ncbi:MAG: Hsp33 family molecular chaperone HslO [Kiritimatiellae bacterium]|nr:Hsp33 family molecular chaperone HslO [Kiritimatiellia bacterium]